MSAGAPAKSIYESVPWAPWATDPTALQDTMRRLDQDFAQHAKVSISVTYFFKSSYRQSLQPQKGGLMDRATFISAMQTVGNTLLAHASKSDFSGKVTLIYQKERLVFEVGYVKKAADSATVAAAKSSGAAVESTPSTLPRIPPLATPLQAILQYMHSAMESLQPYVGAKKAFEKAFTEHPELPITSSYCMTFSGGSQIQPETTQVMDKAKFNAHLQHIFTTYKTHAGKPDFRSRITLHCPHAHFSTLKNLFPDGGLAAEAFFAYFYDTNPADYYLLELFLKGVERELALHEKASVTFGYSFASFELPEQTQLMDRKRFIDIMNLLFTHFSMDLGKPGFNGKVTLNSPKAVRVDCSFGKSEKPPASGGTAAAPPSTPEGGAAAKK